MKSAIYSFIFLLLFFSLSIAEEEIPENGARFEFIKHDVKIKGSEYTETVHKKITIYNSLGENYSEISILENGYCKLNNVSIKVFDTAGNKLYEKKKKDMNKACGYDRVAIYNDNCTYYLTADAPQFPYTIECSYTKKCTSLFFLRGAHFQYRIPVDNFYYKLSIPIDLELNYKSYVFDMHPTVFSTDKEKLYEWRVQNVPPYEDIDYMPDDENEIGKLSIVCNNSKIGDYSIEDISWNGIGDWCNKLYADRFTVALSKNKPVSIKTVEDVYSKIISKIRYVAIEIGVGGWQPYKADLTEKREFGDCKDMSTLLISKLRSNNIRSYPVKVLTKDNGPIDVSFPNLGFDHVIAMAIIDKDTVWMDPTCELCPFGELPLDDEDIDVLVVTEQGGVIRHTPASKPSDNQVVRLTNLFLEQNGLITLNCQYKAIGNYARTLRYYFRQSDKEETEQFVHNMFPGAEKKYTIQNYSINNIEDIEKPLLISVNLKTNKKTDRIGRTVYIDPFILNKRRLWESTDLTDREYSFGVSYPFEIIDTIQISIDSAYNIDSLYIPRSDSVKTAFGNFKYSIVQNNEQITLAVFKKYDTYKITTDQFIEFEEFGKKIKKVSTQYIKVYLSK